MHKRRTCSLHNDNPVVRVCLKDVCECKGVLCQECMRQFKHKNGSNIIDEDSQFFELFRTNSNNPKQSDQFDAALESVRVIWSEGIQIIEKESLKLESTFLLQLNLMYKTFDMQSPKQMVESLLHQYCHDTNMDLQKHIKMVKIVNKYQNNLKNIEKIREKTREIYLKVAKELKIIFKTFQQHFDGLSVLLDKENIFQIDGFPLKQQAQDSVLNGTQRAQTSLSQVKHEAIQKVIEPLIKSTTPTQYPKQPQYSRQEILTLQDSNFSQFITSNMYQYLKVLIVKPITDIEPLIGSFLEKSYCLEELIIQSPIIASQNNIPILLMTIPKLKALVLNCNNQVWKCSEGIYLYQGDQNISLDRFEYFYDFKRNIQELDNTKFFLKEKPTFNIFSKVSTSNKLKNNKIMSRKSPSNKAVLQMTKRLKVKNIWLAYLSNSDLNLKFDAYDLTQMQQMTLGHYSQQCYIIPQQLTQKLKLSKKLKSLTLIKTSHLISSIEGLLSHLTSLEVLIMQDITLLGNDDQIQAFFNKLPSLCPLIEKLSINNLKNVDVSFIKKLPKLQTLILVGGKQLRFASEKKLPLIHLNLFQSDWNFLDLLKSLSHQRITTLNLGFTKFHFKDILPLIKDFTSLNKLCIDKLLFGPELEEFCQIYIYSLKQLSISQCHSKQIFQTPRALLNSKILSHFDISKCDLEGLMLKRIPQSVKFLVISSKNILSQIQQEAFSARGVKIIEYQS